MPEHPLVFTGCFLIHPHQLTHSVRPLLGIYTSLCSTCVAYEIPYCFFVHKVLCTYPFPKEAMDFFTGRKYTMNVSLLTCYLTSHQKVLFGRLSLCVRASCGILYHSRFNSLGNPLDYRTLIS